MLADWVQPMLRGEGRGEEAGAEWGFKSRPIVAGQQGEVRLVVGGAPSGAAPWAAKGLQD